MAIVPLNGSLREHVGKGAARKSRRAGNIPGVVYGHGQPATAVSLVTKEFETALRKHEGGNMFVSLDLAGDKRTALIREVQRDPLTREILHLDFQEVSLTELVRVQVPLHLTGTAIGVKDGGGILQHILRNLEIECLATAMPDSIDADVSTLNIGDSLHVRDLSIEDAEIVSDLTDTIATVVPPTVYEAPAAEDVAVEAEEGEPEVIAKGKDEEKDETAEKGEKSEEKS